MGMLAIGEVCECKVAASGGIKQRCICGTKHDKRSSGRCEGDDDDEDRHEARDKGLYKLANKE